MGEGGTKEIVGVIGDEGRNIGTHELQIEGEYSLLYPVNKKTRT